MKVLISSLSTGLIIYFLMMGTALAIIAAILLLWLTIYIIMVFVDGREYEKEYRRKEKERLAVLEERRKQESIKSNKENEK